MEDARLPRPSSIEGVVNSVAMPYVVQVEDEWLSPSSIRFTGEAFVWSLPHADGRFTDHTTDHTASRANGER
jgi:hypothetical protein